MDCPCHSGMPYSSCCEPFHEGVETPPTAELLMRSRYSAYALGLADYIIATTHPRNPQYNPNRSEWIASIRNFSDEMEFVGLRILDADVQNSSATVTFEAQIFRGTENFSFREKSHFLLENCVWIYLSGDVQR